LAPHAKREEEKMHKQYEEEQWRIERADDARITFTITLHGEHAWEMLLEDSRRYYSIKHGWATDDPRDWENAIAPVLRQFFVKGRLPSLKNETSSALAKFHGTHEKHART
jgi:hypothetical protein